MDVTIKISKEGIEKAIELAECYLMPDDMIDGKPAHAYKRDGDDKGMFCHDSRIANCPYGLNLHINTEYVLLDKKYCLFKHKKEEKK